jgi:hypothetical protein
LTPILPPPVILTPVLEKPYISVSINPENIIF